MFNVCISTDHFPSFLFLLSSCLYRSNPAFSSIKQTNYEFNGCYDVFIFVIEYRTSHINKAFNLGFFSVIFANLTVTCLVHFFNFAFCEGFKLFHFSFPFLFTKSLNRDIMNLVSDCIHIIIHFVHFCNRKMFILFTFVWLHKK